MHIAFLGHSCIAVHFHIWLKVRVCAKLQHVNGGDAIYQAEN